MSGITSGGGGGGGLTTPGGLDTQVQFNDGGSFGGHSEFTYDKSGPTLYVPPTVFSDNSIDTGGVLGYPVTVFGTASSAGGGGGLALFGLADLQPAVNLFGVAAHPVALAEPAITFIAKRWDGVAGQPLTASDRFLRMTGNSYDIVDSVFEMMGNGSISLPKPSASLTFYNSGWTTADYERAYLKWNSNVFTLGTEQGGSGALRDLRLNSRTFGFNTAPTATTHIGASKSISPSGPGEHIIGIKSEIANTGATAPASVKGLYATATASSGDLYGLIAEATHSGSTGTPYLYGGYISLQANSATSPAVAYGLIVANQHTGSTVSSRGAYISCSPAPAGGETVTSYGAQIGVSPSGAGTVTEAGGLYISSSSTVSGTFTNGFGVKVESWNKISGNLTNLYGIYIQEQSAASTLNYNFYSAGTSAKNLYEGILEGKTSSALQYLYNTGYDTANYERAYLRWSSNVFRIGTEKGGSGSLRSLRLDAVSSYLTLDTVTALYASNYATVSGQNGVEIKPTSGWISIDCTNTYFRLSAPSSSAFSFVNSTQTNPAPPILIYNTTDGVWTKTNYEQAYLKWDSNIFKIGTEAGGTGTGRTMRFVSPSGPYVEVGAGLNLYLNSSQKVELSVVDVNVYSKRQSFLSYGGDYSKIGFFTGYADADWTSYPHYIEFTHGVNASLSLYRNYFRQLGVIKPWGDFGFIGDMNLGGKVKGLWVGGHSTAPSAPTVTPTGTPGSTTWGYKITAVTSSGETEVSSEGTTSTGNATLSNTNYNYIVWTPVDGASIYKIYRTTAGGTPNTTGLIAITAGHRQVVSPYKCWFLDYGFTADGTTGPTSNNSSSVKFGIDAASPINFQFAQASGKFSTAGDAQTSVITAFRETTDDTAGVELFIDGADTRITIPANRTVGFKVRLAARQTGGGAGTVGDSSYWEIDGCIKRDGSNNTSLVGSVTSTLIAQDAGAAAWAVSVTADDTNEALKIAVTGEVNKTIHWMARVETVEVG